MSVCSARSPQKYSKAAMEADDGSDRFCPKSKHYKYSRAPQMSVSDLQASKTLKLAENYYMFVCFCSKSLKQRLDVYLSLSLQTHSKNPQKHFDVVLLLSGFKNGSMVLYIRLFLFKFQEYRTMFACRCSQDFKSYKIPHFSSYVCLFLLKLLPTLAKYFVHSFFRWISSKSLVADAISLCFCSESPRLYSTDGCLTVFVQSPQKAPKYWPK
jgi:hypothetical protein